MTSTDFIDELKKRQWKKGALEFTIIEDPELGHRNGYVRFPKRPVKEEDFHGILTYVPVHGGITYAQESPDGSMVYGFDCAHAQDHLPSTHIDHLLRTAEFKHTKDPKVFFHYKPRTYKWLARQCEIMGAGIVAAVRYEGAYLAARGRSKRVQVVQNYIDYLKKEGLGHFDLVDNFGAMINVLCGSP